MILEFTIEDLSVTIPNAPHDNPYHISHTEHHPAYLLIGFNEWFDDAKLVRIPLNSKSLKDLDSFTFKLTGTLPTSQKDLAKYYLGSVICSLMIPVKSKWNRVAPQRHSKCVVLHLENVLQESHSTYSVHMHNKFIRETLFCKFVLRVTRCSSETLLTLKPYLIEPRQCFEYRKELYAEIEHEQKHFKQIATKSAEKYLYMTPEIFNRDIYSYRSYFGEQPTHNYLNYKLPRSNEEWWVYVYEFVMLKRKTSRSLPLNYDSNKLFWSWDVWDQNGMLSEMSTAVSNGAIYLPDAILKSDGTLDPTGSSTWNVDDWSENINEGGDDCDGMTNQSAYIFEAFQNYSGGKFTHPVLEELRKRAQLYVGGVTVASMKMSADPKVTATVCHLTLLLMLKSHLFRAIDLEIMPHIYDLSDEIELSFNRMVEYEKSIGNVQEYAMNGKKRERLPPVIFCEGTMPLYPYPQHIHSPGEKIIEKELRYNDFQAHSKHGFRHDMYQDPQQVILSRFLMFISDWFVTHPKVQVNIPTLLFSTKIRGECTFEKGIDSTEVFLEDTLVMFPQTKLRHMRDSSELLDALALSKFQYCPLRRNKANTTSDKSRTLKDMFAFDETECESRVSSQTTMVTPPNIWPQHRVHLPDIIPEDTSNLVCSWIPSGTYKVAAEAIGKDKIKGRIYIDLLPHVTGYLVWIRI